MDELNKKIWIWEAITLTLMTPESIKKFLSWKDTPLVRSFVRNYVVSNLLESYEGLTAIIRSLNELLEEQSNIPLGQDYIKQVYKEVKENRLEAEKYLHRLTDLYPDLIRSIQNKQASHMILNVQKHDLDMLKKTGSINDEEYEELRATINLKINKLDYADLSWEFDDFSGISMIAPTFPKLKGSLAITVESERKLKTFAKNETIFKKGDQVPGIYIISKGLVEETLSEEFSLRHGMGTILSYSNYVNTNNIALSTLTAISKVETYYLGKETVNKIIKNHDDYEENIYRESL